MQSVDVNGLIEKVKRGDDEAFEALSEKYAPLSAAVAASFESTAKDEGLGSIKADLLQELSLALYRAAKSYDTAQSTVTFGLYAKRCLFNCAVSYLRKCKSAAKRERKAKSKLKERGAVSRFPELSEDELFTVLGDASDVLSPYERRVIGMMANGDAVREIASELGVSAKSVSNAVFRCKTKIKKFYDKDK